MDGPVRLVDFPNDVIRIACTQCDRRGQYRRENLVARFGANMTLPYVLGAIAGDCPRRDIRAPGTGYCGAHFENLRARTSPPTGN